MQKADIIDKVKPIIYNILQNNEIELIDITYRREGRGNVLRIFADTASGITAAECARINELVGEALDREDIIGERYLLEVSSPGLDRPLKTKADFVKELGKKVRIHTYAAIENRKEFTGTIEEVKDEDVFIVTDKGLKVRIAFDKIASARLHF